MGARLAVVFAEDELAVGTTGGSHYYSAFMT